jgi:hypothetical protein
MIHSKHTDAIYCANVARCSARVKRQSKATATA